jgi:hypothetical protein
VLAGSKLTPSRLTYPTIKVGLPVLDQNQTNLPLQDNLHLIDAIKLASYLGNLLAEGISLRSRNYGTN